jgi:hypothetical protein
MNATRTAPALIFLAIPVIGRAETALVERVVDGDTVVVRLDGQSVKVRLIDVDAPESVDPRKPVERFAHESAAFLRGLVERLCGLGLPVHPNLYGVREREHLHMVSIATNPRDGNCPPGSTVCASFGLSSPGLHEPEDHAEV